jgi:hypothetical protein
MGKSFYVDPKCAWKGNGPNLFALIASNKKTENPTKT